MYQVSPFSNIISLFLPLFCLLSNRHGFNVNNKIRYGILFNNENDCKTPDAAIGIGIAWYGIIAAGAGNSEWVTSNEGKSAKVPVMAKIYSLSLVRLSGASLTAAGTCNPCSINTYAKDDVTNCVANTICGNRAADGGTRLTGADRKNAGTCNPCAVNTYAKNDLTDCAANTICGNQAAGITRAVGDADRTTAGTCNPCTTKTWAANEQENCVAHTVCGKQVGSYDARIAAAGSPTTDSQCQACIPGTWGAATIDCQVCEDGKYNSKPVQPVCKDDCNAGSYILQDKSNCLKCPFGKWQNQNGQSSCIKCSKGKVLRLTNQISDKCEECATGTYNPYEGHTGECLPCLTANVKGSIECEGW